MSSRDTSDGDIENRQLQQSELTGLPPDQKFTKIMFPPVFTITRRQRRIRSNMNAVDKNQAMIEWTTLWLERREDRSDDAIDTESQSFQDLQIHDAFNKLSNRQLRLWLDHRKHIQSHLGPNRENCQHNNCKSLTSASYCQTNAMVYKVHVPNNFHFKRKCFPKISGQDRLDHNMA